MFSPRTRAINRIGRTIIDFWRRPIRAEPLAMFRILLGSTGLLVVLTSLGPFLETYLGPEGLCPPEALDPWLKRTNRFSLFRGPVSMPGLESWLPPQFVEAWKGWGATASAGVILFAVWVAALVLLTCGLCTRVAAILAWVLAVSFHNRIPWLLNGGDVLFREGLFYLMLAPAGAVWSMDHFLFRRRLSRQVSPAFTNAPVSHEAGPAVFIPPWSVRLIQIQLCLVYLFTGLTKLGEDWLNGQAVYWVLNDTALTRWPYHRFPVPLSICRILSWATLLFEIGFTFFLFFRRWRRWLLLGGMVFHLGILLATEVGWFSQITLCWYVIFVPPESLNQFFGRLTRRFSRCRFRKNESSSAIPLAES